MININDKNYELIKNEKDAWNKEEFENLFTDYFYEFDYIVGDIAYSKLRLKGFYDSMSSFIGRIIKEPWKNNNGNSRYDQ